MFYDENGKHVRTKKEIVNKEGRLRKGCKIVSKGDVYERKLFTVKEAQFKSESFLNEVKRSYTDLINIYVKDNKERLQVFDHNGAYLPMKKIGKNNPKAEQMQSDNEIRKKWNQTVDRALLIGVPETQIIQIKHIEISKKTKESFRKVGNQPQMFITIIWLAIAVLEHLITQIFKLVYQSASREKVQRQEPIVKESQQAAMQKNTKISNMESGIGLEESKSTSLPIPEKPKRTRLAKKYSRLSEIYEKLESQNSAIYQREQHLNKLEQELTDTRGIFKSRQRKDLQEQIDGLAKQIGNMKQHLSGLVHEYGYQTVKEFLAEYSMAKEENVVYQNAVNDWQKKYGMKSESDSIRERLKYHRQQAKEQENGRQRSSYPSDRGAR